MNTPVTKNLQAVIEAITARYIETGEHSTVANIATALACSESKVRKAIADANGFVPGVTMHEESRPTYSRSYPGMEHGARKVWTYSPTREALRAIILASRAAK